MVKVKGESMSIGKIYPSKHLLLIPLQALSGPPLKGILEVTVWSWQEFSARALLKAFALLFPCHLRKRVRTKKNKRMKTASSGISSYQESVGQDPGAMLEFPFFSNFTKLISEDDCFVIILFSALHCDHFSRNLSSSLSHIIGSNEERVHPIVGCTLQGEPGLQEVNCSFTKSQI